MKPQQGNWAAHINLQGILRYLESKGQYSIALGSVLKFALSRKPKQYIEAHTHLHTIWTNLKSKFGG
jgi:hypothetical protein